MTEQLICDLAPKYFPSSEVFHNAFPFNTKMALLRDNLLVELMVDYVQQRGLEARAGDLSVWEDFRQISGFSSESADRLRDGYLLIGSTSSRTNGLQLQEGVHFTWCNDIRDGLTGKGFVVQRDKSMILPTKDFHDAAAGSGYGAMMDTLTDSRDHPPEERPRTKKKKELTNHERFVQIKRNLERKRRNRRSNRK